MSYADGLSILVISIATAFLCEGIAWVLIYQTSNYQNLRFNIDKTSKKVETMKKKSLGLAAKRKSKKIDRFESTLKTANQSLSTVKMQSGAVVALTTLIVFGILSTIFEGKVVAKLPFVPIAFFQKLSHRGLPGDDATDCSMAFLYMLCSLGIRPNLQKILGFAPPRSATQGMFAAQEDKTK